VEKIRKNFSNNKPSVCGNCQFYIPTVLKWKLFYLNKIK
jgi:hypothetical protein